MTRQAQIDEEYRLFQEFCKHLPFNVSNFESRNPPEPDIRCYIENGECIAFELFEVIDKEFAQATNSMLFLKSLFWNMFKELDSDYHNKLKEILHDGAFFVLYNDDVPMRKKKKSIDKMFRLISTLDKEYTGRIDIDDDDVLSDIIRNVEIRRGIFNGPIWNITTVGRLGNPEHNKINQKVKKSYNTNCSSIHLVGYYKKQPEPHVDTLDAINEFVKLNFSSSQFDEMWLYSTTKDNILLNIKR